MEPAEKRRRRWASTFVADCSYCELRLPQAASASVRGDAINAVLAAAGYNFRRLLAWLRVLLLSILIALGLTAQLKST